MVDNLLTTNCPPDVLGRRPNRGNLVGTATFVDDPAARPGPEGPDLHLQAGSAGIDAVGGGTTAEGGPGDPGTHEHHEHDRPDGPGTRATDIDGQALLGPADAAPTSGCRSGTAPPRRPR